MDDKPIGIVNGVVRIQSNGIVVALDGVFELVGLELGIARGLEDLGFLVLLFACLLFFVEKLLLGQFQTCLIFCGIQRDTFAVVQQQ
jgi:hypothetical protein